MATATAPYTAAPTVKERPTGVLLLAVLYVIEGLLMLLGALAMLMAGAFVGAVGDSVGVGGFTGIFEAVAMVIGVFLLILGLLAFLVAWGLYAGKGWARVVAIVLAVLSLIGGLASIGSITGIIEVVLAILILYYLFQPRVKAYYA